MSISLKGRGDDLEALNSTTSESVQIKMDKITENPTSVSLQIKMDNNKEKTQSLKSFSTEVCIHSIYRVPHVLHEMNDHAYTPSFVAIGPFHRDKKHLQAMEGDKVSYMHLLFERTGNFQETRDKCVGAMLEIESSVGNCYAGIRLDEQGKPHEELGYPKSNGDVKGCGGAENLRLAEMMVIDGCFIIELLYRKYRRVPDPILLNSFKLAGVRHDLLLLENQIPFFVLQRLFEHTIKCITEHPSLICITEHPSLTNCIRSFFGNMMLLEDEIEKDHNVLKSIFVKIALCLKSLVRVPSKDSETDEEMDHDDSKNTYTHILHVLHDHHLPSDSQRMQKKAVVESIEVYKKFKYSATDLDLAGIKFVKGNKKDPFDLQFFNYHRYFCFWRRGRFQIPHFTVDDFTETFLRNVIAFEQCCSSIAECYFTSHALLMDRLINSADDVKLLEKAGIIHNNLGATEDITQLFNNLCKNVVINKIYSTDQCMKVVNFQKQRWPRLLLNLRRDYFGNPWSFISLIAALILFVLTLLQTIYALLTYY